MEPEELADSLKRLAAWAEQHAPTPESKVRRRLHDHLGRDPADLPLVSRELLRRAVLRVAEESEGALSVSASDLERAFEELRHSAGDLTNALLGARPPTGDLDFS
jgi:hypothetical protein